MCTCLSLVAYLGVASAWQMHSLDVVHAKTIIRLWHELHVERQVAHDFSAMLAPKRHVSYIGVANHDDIRAIAECRLSTDRSVCVSIAHAPDQPDAARVLLGMIEESDVRFDYGQLRSQPRWMLEALFVSRNSLVQVRRARDVE